MALGHVQDCTAMVRASGNPLTSTITFPTAITAGNAVIVQGIVQGTANRTLTASDNIVGAYTVLVNDSFATGDQNRTWMFVYPNHPGGTVTVTVTHGSASADFAATASEYSGFGSTISLEAEDKFTDGSTTNTHFASAAGVTYGSDCIAFVSGSTSGGNMTDTAGSTGYAKIPAGYTDADNYFGYKIFPSGATSEVGQWTSTGIARQCTSRIALMAAGSAPPPATGGFTARFIGL